MKRNSWIKQLGIHAAVCLGIIAAAFGMNQKINMERNHTYTVSEPIYTLFKGIETRLEGNTLVFSGWGFDSNYYSEDSRCELILQDTETGEDFWPRMKKNPEPVEIARRYTGGKDYSKAAFEGRIGTRKLNPEGVYEILLRYTASYVDGSGIRQPYVRTVTTDQFLWQGRLMEYNPKTFQAPELAGTELEKELEDARVFHYFPEGLWIYYKGTTLYYIIERSLEEGKENSFCPIHWFVRDNKSLPEERQQYGFGNADFRFWAKGTVCAGAEQYKVAVVPLESEDITYVATGFLYEGAWTLKKGKQLDY